MKKQFKKQAILDSAAELMNEHGAGGLDLAEVAKSIGISKNALYYYFADRKELIYHCYLQNCEALSEHLAIAISESSDPSQQIRIFIHRALSRDFKTRAVISDLFILNKDKQDIVRGMLEKITLDLQEVIIKGVNEGSFRSIDSRLASYSILGILSWSKLWDKWILRNEAGHNTTDFEISESVYEKFIYGLANDSTLHFSCNENIEHFQRKNINVFDREQAAKEKSDQLAHQASFLFNRRGISGVSLDDLCEFSGITKGTIYHYYRDKTALIHRCYELAFDRYDFYIELAEKLSHNEFELLLFVSHLNIQAQASKTPPLILQPGMQELYPEYGERTLNEASRLKKVLEQGVKKGVCRPGSDFFIEMAAGIFFWIGKWFPNIEDINGKDLADSICDIYAHGIRKTNVHC